MRRPRFSPEEADARRRERVRASFRDDHFAHYDPRLPPGSRRQWASIAEAAIDALTGGRRQTADGDPALASRYRRELELLRLTVMPTLEGLKQAYKEALFREHPDRGGVNEKGADGKYPVQRIYEAFERLVLLYPRV